MDVGRTIGEGEARAFLSGVGATRHALGGQLLVGRDVAGWLLEPPEAKLDRADRIAWRAHRSYPDADDVVPELRCDIEAFFAASDGFVYLGHARLGSYRYVTDAEAALYVAPRLTRALWRRLGGSDGLTVRCGERSTEGLEAVQVEREVARLIASGAELWVAGYEEPTLTVLANEQRASVMLLQHDGDSGELAGDPASEGDEAPEAFTLSNGQVDEFPRAWTVTHEQALECVRAFLARRTLASGLRRIQS